MGKTKGSFTLPGEAGYEKLTLELAERWGADVIRDSDGTELSPEITEAGYGIYSTICIIRGHNEWAKAHPEQLQQTFLMTSPKTAVEETLVIHLMEDFFDQQFRVNDSRDAMKYWQVYDRTEEREVSSLCWTYDRECGNVVLQGVPLFHEYTVSFLAYRIWEEISMYNHVTNHWNAEHLMPVDPRYPETRAYLKGWLKNWCETHPATTVVRFTSLFYNFVWIWGSHEENRNLFSDWGSYDFTVSPLALEEFEKAYGYGLTAEDFINQGKLHVTHMPPSKKQKDYMQFIMDFVLDFGKELVELVHQYGKKAYVFYDDSWVGLEPYRKDFKEFGFDGLIKCVFSGYEARLCAGADVETHELRLHPYLFPVGLGGAPTFCEGGDPTRDAKVYWKQVRRALLRQKIDRIGLGGYLHLVQDYPDFCEYMEKVADEFRTIKTFHENGAVYTMPVKVAVLHSWGALRSWTLSGHFHETWMHDLIQVNEALSGLPYEVRFIDFQDVKDGALKDVDVVINAGDAGSAWSGGENWKDAKLVECLTRWVYEGGTFLGIKEPSAVDGFGTRFRMSHVLGVDRDMGERVCHGKWQKEAEQVEGLIPAEAQVKPLSRIYLTDETVQVLKEEDGVPSMTLHKYGKGMGIYLGSFQVNDANTRLLSSLIQYGAGQSLTPMYQTDNLYTECAYYPGSHKLVMINNSGQPQTASVQTEQGTVTGQMEPYETIMITVQ